jgi:hypothetical protein
MVGVFINCAQGMDLEEAPPTKKTAPPKNNKNKPKNKTNKNTKRTKKQTTTKNKIKKMPPPPKDIFV